MNKKRIRQMSSSLLRRLTTQPAVRYLAGRRETLRQLLEEGSRALDRGELDWRV